MKICPVGAELFHADGQMDMAKLPLAFCNFVKAPKNTIKLVISWDVIKFSLVDRYQHL
jgi:hypothetical protein